ncbi:MAG: hypothetical protein ACI4EA_01155 [Candidatus Ornithomonoglobus sp.]
MKKSEYKFPEITVMNFQEENIITASGKTAEEKLISDGAFSGTEHEVTADWSTLGFVL